MDENHAIQNIQEAEISNLVEKTRLCRDPRPTRIKYNIRNKFLGHAFKNNLIKNEYRIKSKCETTENPQANSTLEIFHQVTANLVHTFDLQNIYLDKYGSSELIFSVRCMYHSTLRARWCVDMILY